MVMLGLTETAQYAGSTSGSKALARPGIFQDPEEGHGKNVGKT